MPNIVHGNLENNFNHAIFAEDLDYDYPEGTDLRPNSELHNKLVNNIMQRAREANAIISNRFDAWKEVDHTLTTYIDLTESEQDLQKTDPLKPVSIVFPYTHAILETVLGYLISAFVQNPMIRYEGTSPEDTIGAIMMEQIIEKHNRHFKTALPLHTMYRDDLAYGFGVAAPRWTVEWGSRTIARRINSSNPFKDADFVRDKEETVLFEGNELMNIDPYLCLPDPNVPIHDVQKMEYFGWLDRTNYMDLLSEEKHSDGDLFNVKYLKGLQTKTSVLYGEDRTGRNTKSKLTNRIKEGTHNKPVDLIRMFVKLIPKDWKLGDNEYPEKWLFTIASDSIIVEARPIELDHGKFPLVVSASEFDGYSSSPISRIESLLGLQKNVDWLFNSHVANVRKAIQDMFIIDPYIVNINDVRNPGPGKLIRTRRPMWGRGVKDSIMQFPVNDVTRQNIADVSFMTEYMKEIAGTGRMGSQRSGGPERLTGTEFQGTQRELFSRLEKIARIIGLQSMQELGGMFAHHTQQFMEEDTYVKTTGRWQETLMKEYAAQGAEFNDRMQVSPMDILVDYDIDARDGTVPGNNFSDVWVRMFETIGKYPELQQEFDVVRIFKHIARNNGAKNVEDFTKIKTVDPGQVQNQVQQGNLIPTEGVI